MPLSFVGKRPLRRNNLKPGHYYLDFAPTVTGRSYGLSVQVRGDAVDGDKKGPVGYAGVAEPSALCVSTAV